MKRNFFIIILLSTFVLAALLFYSWKTASAAPLLVHQQNNACGTWKVASSPNPGSGTNFLNGVAAISAGNAWAVGSYSHGSGSFALIEHRGTAKWTVVSSPGIAGSLSGIAALTASNIWAVGENDSAGMQQSLIEHWNGKAWKIVSSPVGEPPGSTLAAISAVSAKDIWAVGTTTSASSTSGYQPLAEHWNGARWRLVSTPALSGRFFSVAAIKSNNVWAVGDNLMPNFTGSLIEHWNGTRWSVVSSPNPGPAINILNAVVKISASNVWAAGDSTNSPAPSAEYTPLIEHWNGTRWSVVTGLLQGTSDFVNGMVAISSKNITVVGDYRASLDPQGPYFTLVEHWNGARWSVVTSPSPGSDASDLVAAARVPKTKHIWAVGFNYDGAVYQTLAEKSC
jgi:hypothetical protein